MHFHSIREKQSVRAWARFDLPTNPICWALGHKAKVTVVESSFASIPPWRLVRCRVCDLRYSDPHADKGSWYMVEDRDQRRLMMDLEQQAGERRRAGQVEVARRDPKQVEMSCSGREGYGHHQLSLGAELHWRGMKGLKTFAQHAGFRLHTGGRGSETPYDAHLDLGFAAVFLQIGGVGGRWAEFIGRGHGRDLSLSLHGGHLWWKLWYDGDSGNDDHHRCDSWRPAWWSSKRKHRPWRCLRDGNAYLNPVNNLYGSPSAVDREPTDWREALVVIGQFPGDEYLVRFRLEPYKVRRKDGPRWARRVLREGCSLAWDAHYAAGMKGIPVQNHDWKGDEILSGHQGAPEVPAGEDWLPKAVEVLRASVVRDRERYNYRPPRTFSQTLSELVPEQP